ncbi:hypothetical protein AWC17_00540 [Mycobacterium nebraskense]|uniref:Uncharacterized protein n=1 Tax=Mycobacterium nebraskense TaxID=244292 RepID=A0A1X2A1G1_9MYCO|nr:hypothetical protein WU83_12340 [Mycobacterium nebraskense]ORW34945.1 hypothetical protein AWC17_00540 [Mycobacterium nebraskense]
MADRMRQHAGHPPGSSAWLPYPQRVQHAARSCYHQYGLFGFTTLLAHTPRIRGLAELEHDRRDNRRLGSSAETASAFRRMAGAGALG